MMKVQIRYVACGASGVVQKIGNESESWSRLEAVQAIRERRFGFFVQALDTPPSDIEIYQKEQLLSAEGGPALNRLECLPPCRDK